MTRKKKEEAEVVADEVVIAAVAAELAEKERAREATSIRRDCARGEHDGEVVMKEGKAGLGMPEVRVCERCGCLFVEKKEEASGLSGYTIGE